MAQTTEIVSYVGVCPLCGSQDGMVQKGEDGRYRNICRVLGCKAYYRPAPFDGYDTQKDAENPFDSPLLLSGCTGMRYLYGEEWKNRKRGQK